MAATKLQQIRKEMKLEDVFLPSDGTPLRLQILSLRDNKGHFLHANGFKVGDQVLYGKNKKPLCIRNGCVVRDTGLLKGATLVRILRKG